MTCPKCKAKVGIMRHRFAVETGLISCIKCCICGYWVQEYPNNNERMMTLEALASSDRQRSNMAGA
ncbi:MAG: hypothetical protein NDI77_08545 [Geobacteraceae bacterium]|nr:hypothetical protein [Geobacteraceae bacterium]